MQYRTDLAMERAADFPHIEGLRTQVQTLDCCTLHDVRIENDAAAQQLQKPCGRYVTLEIPPPGSISMQDRERIARALSDVVTPMLPPQGDILVIGLGNRHITSDALGTKTVDSLLVTRHLRSVLPESLHNRLRGVCAFAPGVLGVTGMESADMAQGACAQVHPAAIICIDALAARECARIGTTVQITDTGIQPGSGVGNHRHGITQDAMGVPVIAIGVPTVVYSAVIVRDALGMLLEDISDDSDNHGEAADALAARITGKAIGEMVVTPREIDQMVSILAQIIAMGLNFALQQQLTGEEIALLTHEVR